MARGWGRKDSVIEWEADGVLHGDGDAMCAQLMEFAEVGVSEVTISISDIDQAIWLNEEVASRLTG